MNSVIQTSISRDLELRKILKPYKIKNIVFDQSFLIRPFIQIFLISHSNKT